MEDEELSEEGRTREKMREEEKTMRERQKWRKIKGIGKYNRSGVKKSCSIQQWMTRHANVIDN